MFEHEKLQAILDTIDPLLADSDRYKQRSGAELLAGLSRGKEEPQRKPIVMSLNSDRLKALAQATCGLLVVMDHRSSRPHLWTNEAGHDFILGEPPECTLSLLYATLTTHLTEHSYA